MLPAGSIRRHLTAMRTLGLPSILLAGLMATAPTSALGQSSTVTPTRSAAADSAEVVRISTALLAALSARDTATVRSMLVPGAFLASVMSPAGDQAPVRFQSETQFLTAIGSAKERLLERLWDPRVILHGSLAEVHAPYDFFVNGTFSHCGIDVFTLMRHQGAWRVASIMYTVQRTGCAPSPLGPPGV